MKHILFILPNLRGGGAEKLTINLANYFIFKNYKVTIIILNKSTLPEQQLDPTKITKSGARPLMCWSRCQASAARPRRCLPCPHAAQRGGSAAARV